jgi:hypothetical protein
MRRLLSGVCAAFVVAVLLIPAAASADFTVPPPPIADGGVSVDGISLNGHAGNRLIVAPGADVKITGTATDKNVGCPGCVMFADVAFRGAGAAAGCFGNSMIQPGSASATTTGTVDLGNAPTALGFYDIVLEGQAQFNCGDGWTANGGTTTAQIRVVARPVCPAVTSSTAYATPVTITLACTGTTLAYTVTAGGGPAHGTLGAIGGNQVLYTPAAGFSGTDTFHLTATDAAGSTAAETVTVDVGPAPAPSPTPILQPSALADRDHDGIPDTTDRCPTVPRGAFDRDNDGCPGPYQRINAKLSGTWAVGDHGVKIGSMTFGPVPVGTKIRMSCSVCHTRQTITAKRRTVSLSKLRGKLLKRGGSFTATATKPGFIGQQITLTAVQYGHRHADFEHAASNPFNRRTLCIPAGAIRPAKTCSATPPTGP